MIHVCANCNEILLFHSISDNSVFEFTDRNRVLTVRNIHMKRDIMCIQCVVRNDIGRSFANACLNIACE